MYTHRKPFREDFHPKSRKNQEIMPSFSSSLLDEIYRSIDGNAHDGGAATFRRARLVENWMKLDDREAAASKRRESLMQDNDLMFFSSTSCSSDSSGALSSSDTEFFASAESRTRPKVSCFSAKPRPVRTGEDGPNRMKPESRALKMYANLKKVKQPISPGGRLSSFLNSLFSSNNAKSARNAEKSKKGGVKSPDCPSSASSFSRSCLSKYSPRSREKMRNGEQRTVRFHPVSVIVDEESRPCGQKCTYDEEFTRPPPPPTAAAAAEGRMGKGRKVEEAGCNKKTVEEFSIFRKIHKREDEDDDDDDDDDCLSDASSDLFELDHLALFGDKRFCEELPVYETTHIATNRAIASGLVR